MSKRNLFFLLLIAILFLIASGIPKSSPKSGQASNSDFSLIAGRNVNMVSGTKLPGGDPWLQRQNEPSIAVSTRNPMHLLAGANDYRTVDYPATEGELPGLPEGSATGDAWLGIFKSIDGGESWATSLLPGFPQDTSGVGTALKGYAVAADPVVRAGPAGLFYYSGIAFNRQTPKFSCVFVARFIDENNTESAGPIQYLDTTLVQHSENELQFIDKPWIAVDKPRDSRTLSLHGQSIPVFNVYLAYSVFYGTTSTSGGAIMFASSTSSGQAWSTPIKLVETAGKEGLNQGACVAVDPKSGAVYVAWRNFNKNLKKAAIYVAKSTNQGQTFGTPVQVAKNVKSFDQGTTSIAFRTSAYPTMAVDGNGIVYLAWSERVRGEKGPATIQMTTSANGTSWAKKPWEVEVGSNSSHQQGHQFMPSLAFASGQLILAWYDQRDDASEMFTEYIDESYPIRRTIDVRVTVGTPGLTPVFEPSIQVSRYLFVLTSQAAGGYTVEQAQFNPPDYPLFKGGTSPFHGDYLDVSGSPAFVLKSGKWEFNTDVESMPVYHITWTDNRDVRPPADNNWTIYTPPASNQGDYGYHGCSSNVDRMGMRNQNIYTAKVSKLEAGAEMNYKTLGLNLGYYPSGALIPRVFVLYVKNPADVIKSFRLSVVSMQSVDRASFEEFKDISTLDVEIAPYSSISRPLFVSSTNPQGSVTVLVSEIDQPGGSVIPGGLSTYIYLNSDPTNPEIPPGDPTQYTETYTPNIGNPNIASWVVINPNVANPNVMNSNVANPNVMNPNVANPNVANPNVANPNFANPNIMSPNVANPNVANPNVMNPNVMNPNIMSASLDGAEVKDVVWKVTNEGNTTSSYTFKMFSKKQIPPGIYAQLLVYRVHKVPGVLYSVESSGTVADCYLREEEHHELLLNIPNPNVMNPNVANPNVGNPNVENPNIENATFSVPPGGEATVVLRVVKPPATTATSMALTTANATTFSLEDFCESVGAAATAQAVNTEEAQIGVTTPPVTASKLVIVTSSLPDGVRGYAYYKMLEAAGGTTPYSWALNAGELPDGLTLGGDGSISGTPTKAGLFYFNVQVQDTGGQFDTQRYSIYINSDTTPSPLTITTTSLPSGVQGYLYAATLEATGGYWPRVWSLFSGTLPDGLVLDSGGVISGNPMQTGTFNFTVRVTDAHAMTADKALSLVINVMSGINVTISGTVRDGSKNPIEGVILRGLPDTPTTGSDGTYSITVPQGWSGTAVPFRVGYEFTPSEQPYDNIQTNQTKDYTGSNVLVSEGWVARYNGPAWADADYPVGMVLDSSGNVYVTGSSQGGPTHFDFATVKYNGAGNLAWVNRNIGPASISIDYPYAIAKDSADNIYVTGTSYVFGGPTTYAATTVKYDSSGNLIWTARHSTTASSVEEGYAITFDSSGNIYVAAYSSNGSDVRILTIKYDSSGHELWFDRYSGGGSLRDVPVGIAVDSQGNVYVAGNTTTATMDDFITIKYNSSGKLQWRQTYNGTANDNDSVVGIRVDPWDKVIVVGKAYFTGTNTDYVTIKYDSAGNQVWLNRYSTSPAYADTAYGMTLDSSGNIYVTGRAAGHCRTVKYGSDGTQLWVTNPIAPSSYDSGQAVTVDASGYVYVAGYSYSAPDWFYKFLTVKYKQQNGEIVWSRTDDGGNLGNDNGQFIAVDSSGNVFVSGNSEGSSTNQDYLTVKYNSEGVFQWRSRYNGPTNDDTVTAAVVDPSGNTYVTGQSYGIGTFSDITTVKFDATGNQAWVARYDGPSLYTDYPTAIALDGTGYVYVSGVSNYIGSGTKLVIVKYNPSTGSALWTTVYDAISISPRAMAVDAAGNVYITGSSGQDYITLKFDSGGNYVWNAIYNGQASGEPNRQDYAVAVKTDALGNVYVVGNSLNTSGVSEIALVKYDSAGAQQWVRHYSAPSSAVALYVDAVGNAYVAGNCNASGTNDYLTLKFDTSGTQQWAKTYDGTAHQYDTPTAIVGDASGNVYITGSSISSLTYDDFTTIKYDSSGNQLWVAFYDGSGFYDRALSIALDADGNVYVAGQSQAHTVGRPEVPEVQSDFATVKYDQNGNLVWVARYNGPGYTTDIARYVGLDASGFVYTVGQSIGAGGAGSDFTVIRYRQR